MANSSKPMMAGTLLLGMIMTAGTGSAGSRVSGGFLVVGGAFGLVFDERPTAYCSSSLA